MLSVVAVKVFNWLVGKINEAHRSGGGADVADTIAFVGILDIFGKSLDLSFGLFTRVFGCWIFFFFNRAADVDGLLEQRFGSPGYVHKLYGENELITSTATRHGKRIPGSPSLCVYCINSQYLQQPRRYDQSCRLLSHVTSYSF